MSRFNKIILIGKIIESPELKQTSSGDSVCTFTIEVDRPNNEALESQSDRFTINAWRDLADSAASLTVNSLVIVDGSIRNRTYDNNEGQRVYVTEIEAKAIKALAANSTAASESSIPVIEEASPKAEEPFDFNEAIKSDSSSEFVTQLGEDVPF